MHTVKFETIINAHTNEILNIFPDTDKNHDFKTFENSKLKFLPETIILADKGYQGLQKIHSNTFSSIKISKNNLKQVKLKFLIRLLIKLAKKLNMFLRF